jgi:hypothetical protein
LLRQHQISFDQSIHVVMPNNEKLVRSARITSDTKFDSIKIDTDEYENEYTQIGVENEDGDMEENEQDGEYNDVEEDE